MHAHACVTINPFSVQMGFAHGACIGGDCRQPFCGNRRALRTFSPGHVSPVFLDLFAGH